MRLIGALSLLWLAWAQGISAQSPGPANSVELITAARVAQNAMIRAGNLDSVATFWTSDVVVLAGLGARVDGRDALRAAFASDSIIRYQRHPDEVVPSAGWPIAWERGRWIGVLRADTTIVLLGGRYSARWLYEENRWRIQSEQFVADTCHPVACQLPLARRPTAP